MNTFTELPNIFDGEFKYRQMDPKELRKQMIAQNGNKAKHLRIPRPDLKPIIKELIQQYVDDYDTFGFDVTNTYSGIMPKYKGPEVKMYVDDIEDPFEIYSTKSAPYIIAFFNVKIDSQYGSVRIGHSIKIYEGCRPEITYHSDELINGWYNYKKLPQVQEFLKQVYLSIPKDTPDYFMSKDNIMLRGLAVWPEHIGIIGYSRVPKQFRDMVMTDPVVYVTTAGFYSCDSEDVGYGVMDLIDLFNDLNQTHFNEWFEMNYPSVFDKLKYFIYKKLHIWKK